jgi:hypothetical protein
VRAHLIFRSLVSKIDRRLRALHGVTEYTSSPHCLFRMEIAICRTQINLGDGTLIRVGDRIVRLHLWNEQIPTISDHGPTLGWGLLVNRRLQTSLRELELFLTSRPDFNDIMAIRAEMALGDAKRTDQLVALAGKYGFERAAAPKRTLANRLHRLGENILMAMLVLLHNPASFRISTLRRTCTPVILSRATLRERFAARSDKTGSSPKGTMPSGFGAAAD